MHDGAGAAGDGTGDAPLQPMIEVRSEIDIAAPAELVWQVLVDLGRFADWNPFIREAGGRPAPGARVWVRPRTGIGLRPTFRPRIITCVPGRELRWRGHYLSPWLARGEHAFTLEPLGAGVRFTQSERFEGWLVPLAARLVGRVVRAGFAAMNRALKERAEGMEAAARPLPG